MASSRAFARDVAGASSSPPANAGGSAPSVSLGSSVAITYENGTEVVADVAVDTQVQQWGYNVYAGSDAMGISTASALVSLGVSTAEISTNGGRRRRRLKLVPRRLGAGNNGDEDAPLTLVLQNVRPIDYGDGASNEYVNLTCPPEFVGRVSAICPGTNATVAANCSGRYPTLDPTSGLILSFETSWSTRMGCATTVEPTCLLWDAARQAYDATLCRPVNWTSTNTTCECSADASAIAASAGGASFTSGSAALAGYFGSMFDSSAFGPNLFLQNPLLIATFVVIFVLVVLNMVIGIRNDMRDNAAGWTTVEAAKSRRHMAAPSGLEHKLAAFRAETGVEETVETRAKLEATRTVAQYAEDSMPSFVSDRTLCHSFGRALVENHGWIAASAWGPFDPITPRYIRAQVLGISTLWLLVALAVQMQLAHPDLGCEQYTNEADCLVMTSPFDPNERACAWDPLLEDACALAPPDASTQFTPLNMAMLVIVMLTINPLISLVEVAAGCAITERIVKAHTNNVTE